MCCNGRRRASLVGSGGHKKNIGSLMMSSSMPMWLVRAWCRLCLVRVRVRVRVRVVPIWRTRPAHSLTALVGATGLGGENKAGSAGQPEDTKARSRLELDLALAAGAGASHWRSGRWRANWPTPPGGCFPTQGAAWRTTSSPSGR